MSAFLGIDAALRETGLALIYPGGVVCSTLRYLGKSADGLLGEADDAISALLERSYLDGEVTLAAVEIPPPKIREGRRYEGGPLGFASGCWFASCWSVTSSVRSVQVGEWRRVVLGQGKQGTQGKAWARLIADGYCRKVGAPLPANHHEAEAICIALWAKYTWESECRGAARA